MTERASPLKEKASAMDFPVLCKPENIAEAFLSPFHGMGGEYLFVLPPHGLPGGKGLFHIQQTLVAAAPEPQGDIVLGFNKFAVHQHIQQAQQLVGGFAPGKAWLFAGQLLPGVAGVAPDRFMGVEAGRA